MHQGEGRLQLAVQTQRTRRWQLRSVACVGGRCEALEF